MSREALSEEQREWIKELIKDDPAATWLRKVDPPPPAGAEPQAWHEFYLNAWQTLRFDRQYFGMGGQTPISFMAIDGFARRFDMTGDAFDNLLFFLQQIDAEWIAMENEKVVQRKDVTA